MAAVLSEKHQREMTDAVRRHADAMQACEEDRARLRLVAVIFLVECLGRSCCNVGSRTGARGGEGVDDILNFNVGSGLADPLFKCRLTEKRSRRGGGACRLLARGRLSL